MTVPRQSLPTGRTEPRWPAFIALAIALVLVTTLPSHYQVAPKWFPWTVLSIVAGSMMAVTLVPASIFWHRLERRVVLTLFTISCGINILTVGRLVGDMITHKHGYSSITLLESGTAIWTVNILLFALLYWQLDSAGPIARAAGASGAADFHFSEAAAETTPPWEPGFVDYLYLAFAAATSFTPPDYARPSTHRAKMVLMLQSTISLTTLFLIASRAIATLS